MGAYLLERGFLENSDFVEGFVSIQEVGGLNCNLCVVRENGPGYFLKQYRGETARRTRRYAAEAELYTRAAEEEWLAGLRPFLPRLLLHDSDRGLLVLEFIADPNLAAAEEPDGSVQFPDVAPSIAEALAACHLAQVPSDDFDPPSGFSIQEKPWALEISRPTPALLVELAPAQITLLRTIQRHEAVCSILTELREGWAPTTLIHGDIKWSNMLASADSLGALGVKIVDWELAKIGDPAWDVGSVFQSYASYSVAATPLQDATPEDAAERFGEAINQAKPHIRRFWSTYADLAVPERERAAFLERSIQFAGSRLLQTAYEWCQGDTRMSRPVVSILQLGLNLIVNPRQAASVLLDLSDATIVVA